MRADRKAMRLVAQPLHEVENRIAGLEHEGQRASGNVKVLAAGVAIGALGDAYQRDVVDTELPHDVLRDLELASAPVDQHEIRAVWKVVGLGSVVVIAVLLLRQRWIYVRRQRRICL